MQTLFRLIYESLCGKNQELSDYRSHIYSNVGLLTLIIAIVIALFFYLALGRWRMIWYTRTHWVITLVLAALLGFSLAYSIAKTSIGSVDAYLIQFAFLNAVLLVVYFIALSLVFKNFSIYSKRTPL
jgi:hypothetical protein